MDPIATSQAYSFENNSNLLCEIDAKPEDSECFTEREQTFEESDHDVSNLTYSTSSGVGSTISFQSHDDLRGGHSWKNLKHSKLQTSKSVPEFEQDGKSYVFHIERANMCQFASGQGRNKLTTGEDETVLSTVDLSKRVRENTKRLLRDVQNIKPKVDTELLRYGKAKLTRSKKLPFIILKGSGCGCKFTAKVLFQEELNRNKEAVGYCLTDPKHFSEIDLNQKSVVLILDACGGTQFDKYRIDEWHDAVRNCMPSVPVVNSDITIILTVQNFDEVNEHPLLKEYSTHVLDATSKKVRPSTETKKQMVIAIMKQHYFEIQPPKQRVSDGLKGFCLEKELIDTIGPLLGSIGYVRRLNQFFRNSTSEGIHFFEKPIPEFVERFRRDFEENKEYFLTMLSVYCHGGSIGFNHSHQTRKYNSTEKKSWRSVTNIPKAHERAPKYNKDDRLKLHWKFAKENNLWQDLYDTVKRHAHEMEGQFLEESNGIYRFASQQIYNSFVVVLCERYSEAIEFCEEEFFFKCIKPGAGDGKQEFLLVDGRTDNERLEAFMKRLIHELLKGNVSKCMNHPALSPQLFRKVLHHLKQKRHLTWKVLNMQDKDITGPFSCLVYGMDCQSNLPSGKIITITDVIIKDGLWEKKRKKRKWHIWTNIQENEAMIYAARRNRVDTFISLVDMGAEISLRCFHEVIRTPSLERGRIIEEIINRARFTQDEWLTEGHHLLQQYVSSRKAYCLFHLQSLLSNVNLNAVDSTTEPFLHRVVRAGDIEAVKVLISDVAVKERLDIDLLWERETALLIAAESGFAEIVSFLLQCGAKRRIRGLRT